MRVGWKNTGRAVAVAAALAVLAPGLAAADPSGPNESQEKQRHAEELAVKATQMLMRALDLLMESLPQYGPPRINENGDIVIPRLHKEPAPGPGVPKPERTAKPAPGTPL